MAIDEFTFTVNEKQDRNKETYFFGSIRLFNAVVFIFPSDNGVPGEWKAVVRPYSPKDSSATADDQIGDERHIDKRKRT